VKLSTPRWWYQRERRTAPVARALLRPASWVYAWATARRIARTQPLDSGATVISVGNLTMGGSGKTPVAREFLARLRAQGVDAHALSRGYGGSEAGPLRVDPTRHSAAEVGDEPLMLAADVPTWIARDRVAGARGAVAAGAQALVLDDAHQNPTLRKALSLVVVDGETREDEWPFGDVAVFPAGPMREPLHRGLARADAVVILLPADLAAPEPELMALFPDKPVLVARLEPAAPPPAGPQLGFAGVAKPWKVERALRAAGAELVDFVPLPDHAALDERTLRMLADRAAAFEAGLVTTEKDWVRLPPAWRDRIAAWPVRARFEDEAALDRLLQHALSSLGLDPRGRAGTSMGHHPPTGRFRSALSG
jgi:tetraacyldisaccharide 4'-kinase